MEKLVIEYDIVYGEGIVINGELYDRGLFRTQVVAYLQVGSRFLWGGVKYEVMKRTYEGGEKQYLYTFICQDVTTIEGAGK